MSSKESTERIVVITDASCLIILHKINALQLLKELFTAVITTPEIALEYGSNLPDWIIIISAKNKKMQEDLSSVVDSGEASAITLAHEIENNYLITDDLQARKLALKLGLPMIGTLGLLLIAKQKNTIPLIAPYLSAIKQTNFRISEQLLNTILKESGEI